jgi:hypothetical protein
MNKCILCLGLLLPLAGLARTDSLDWSAFGGGAGSSASADYKVDGTIGQPAAGHSASASYTLEVGFWSIAGAPYLWVVRTPTNTVYVWWTLSDVPWKLQACTALLPGGSSWTERAYQTNGPNCFYLEAPATEKKSYRLSTK